MKEIVVSSIVHESYAQSTYADVIVLLDINECDEDANLCQMNGNCVNVPGSFRCFCPDGYSVANRGKMCVGKLRYKIETNTFLFRDCQLLTMMLNDQRYDNGYSHDNDDDKDNDDDGEDKDDGGDDKNDCGDDDNDGSDDDNDGGDDDNDGGDNDGGDDDNDGGDDDNDGGDDDNDGGDDDNDGDDDDCDDDNDGGDDDKVNDIGSHD